jgi:hypothetical protein
LATLALGAVLGGAPLLATPRLHWLEAALAGLGLAALAVTLVGDRRVLAGAIVAFAAEMVALDAIRSSSTLALALYGAGLLGLGELASFSVGLRAVERVERAVLARRSAAIVLAAVGALAVAALVGLASHAAVGGGLGAGALGVAATVAAIGLVAVLARSRGA